MRSQKEISKKSVGTCRPVHWPSRSPSAPLLYYRLSRRLICTRPTCTALCIHPTHPWWSVERGACSSLVLAKDRRILAKDLSQLQAGPYRLVFCNFERAIGRVQKCPDQKHYGLILKCPASQEVLIYSVSEILLSGSCWTGQFRVPCDKPHKIGCRHAPSLANCNWP